MEKQDIQNTTSPLQIDLVSIADQATSEQATSDPNVASLNLVRKVIPQKQKEPTENKGSKCFDCGKFGEFAINRKEGTIVCQNCGIVQQARVIDESSEWRNFSNDNGGGGQSTGNRVGGKLNPYLQDFGLSTMVRGHKELQMWSERTQMTSLDRTVQQGHMRIKEVAQCLSLKDACVQKAFELYKRITDAGSLKGRTIDSRVATVVFMASRMVDQPKDIKKILAFTDCSQQELSKCYKQVKQLFPETQARMYASKVAENACNALNLPMDLVQACKQTADNLSALHAMEGKKPQTVAGTAIMMVLKYSSVSSVGIEQVAEKVDIKVGTIQETLRQNMCLVEHVLPDFWQNQLKK